MPPEFRTAVVIPTLFGSVEAVREALENLEVQFLANREAHLHFAVLSDFTDAPTETREDDAAIVAAAVEGVRRSTPATPADGEDAFYLFHRPRRWNPHEGVWMGWERKRGKLAEFNRFLRGGARERVLRRSWATWSRSGSVRYVITLDADTVLPPDAAPLLVGALAHPLNRAVYDPALGRVVRGYGILQPRVGRLAAERAPLASSPRSTRAIPGVDPYTTAVSDVYQDLYGEGSFTGKGIYDVDAFEQATHGRFPENTLLSHDLIEGNYARAGLATDIDRLRRLPDPLPHLHPAQAPLDPGRLAAAAAGSPPRVPGPDGPEPNRLSLLSRWKILDNLRRSTVEIAQLALPGRRLDAAPGSPLRWTLLGLGAIAAPWIVVAAAGGAPPAARQVVARLLRRGGPRRGHQRRSRSRWPSPSCRTRPGSRPTRSSARSGGSASRRRHLLEWQTASQTERGMSGSARRRLARRCGRRWRSRPSILVRGRSGGRPPRADAAARLLAARGRGAAADRCSGSPRPSIAHALSAPARAPRAPAAAPSSRRQALRYALLHWRFFDRFVTAETNWLAPDNFQEDPDAGRGDAHLAHQHRAPAAGHRQRLRPRLHHRSTT